MRPIFCKQIEDRVLQALMALALMLLVLLEQDIQLKAVTG
jgi:hypothetical protein